MNPSVYYSLKKTMIVGLLPVLLASLMIIAMTPSLSAVTDADGDGVTDDVEQYNERSIHATLSSSQVLLDSRGEADRLLFDIDLSVEGLSINTTYFENGDIPDQTDSFTFSLHRLIEFTDTDGDGIYNASRDPPPIRTMIPTNWAFESYKDDSLASGLHVVEFHAPIGSTGETLGIKAYLGSTFGLAGSRLVTPTALKFDVAISGVMFSPSTRLAAWITVTRNDTATVETETEVERLFSASGETGMRLGDNTSVRGSVSWVDEAFVDGNPVPVPVYHGNISQATGGSLTTVHEIYITLAEGSKVDWDARVGMDGILVPDVPIAPPAPIPWETIGLVAVVIITGITSGALAGRYVTRRRVEVLKSNKQGDPNANRWKAPELNSNSDGIIEGGKVYPKGTKGTHGNEAGTMKGNLQGTITPDGQPLRPLKPNLQQESPKADLHLVESMELAVEKVERARVAHPGSPEPAAAVDVFIKIPPIKGESMRSAPGESAGGGSKVQDHNSSRSNKSSSVASPDLDDGGGGGGGSGGSKVQDHNSSRSNKTASSASPDTGGGDEPTDATAEEKERGITINTSHVEYETKTGARSPGGEELHRPPRLVQDASERVDHELHRPPSLRAHDKSSPTLAEDVREKPKEKVNKIESFTIKQKYLTDSAAKLLRGDALSPPEARELGQLAHKLRYGNPLSDEEIDTVSKMLSHNSKEPVDARKVLARRDSRTMLREGLDQVVKTIERATSGLKDTLKTQV